MPTLTDTLATLYRDESRRVLATLIRLLGDFDLAEEALHEAFRVAMEQWPPRRRCSRCSNWRPMSWPTTTWPMPPRLICTVAWAIVTLQRWRTNGRWTWPSRARIGSFSKAACAN